MGHVNDFYLDADQVASLRKILQHDIDRVAEFLRNRPERHEDELLEYHRTLERVKMAGKSSALSYVLMILDNIESRETDGSRKHQFVVL